MTAALVHLTDTATRGLRGRAGPFLTVLALVLPVPLFAALGLSLPLPATVERIAAKLVPFGNADALDANASARAADGTIVLGAGEQRPRGQATESAGSVTSRNRGPGQPAATAGGPRGGTGRDIPANGADPTTSAATASGQGPAEQGGANAPTSGDGTSAPGQGTPPPGGSSDPGDPTPVDIVVSTANGAVSSASDTATNTATSTADTADSTANTLTTAVGGIHPP